MVNLIVFEHEEATGISPVTRMLSLSIRHMYPLQKEGDVLRRLDCLCLLNKGMIVWQDVVTNSAI
jgi:hypothetical protein